MKTSNLGERGESSPRQNRWPMVRLGDVLQLQRRWIKLHPTEEYREIGIRSFGKGIFHKAPIQGSTLGNKRVLRIEPGDLVFNNVFAWEGAVAVAGLAEAGMIGSHRFVTYTVNPTKSTAEFLKLFFKTPSGLELLLKASPGSAGRNKTLGLNRFISQSIPLPPLADQRRVVARIEELAVQIHEARILKSESKKQSDQFWKALSRMARDTTYPVRSVDEMAEFLDGRRIPLNQSERSTRRGPFPYYGSSGIIDHVEGYLFDEPLLLLSEDGANLINRTTPIAFVATGKYWVNNHAHVLRPRDGVAELHFLEYALSDYDVSAFNFASAQAKLNQKNARLIRFPLPPLAEQRRIVAELDALQAEVDALKRLQAETAAELDALLPAILDRAFKGEL